MPSCPDWAETVALSRGCEPGSRVALGVSTSPSPPVWRLPRPLWGPTGSVASVGKPRTLIPAGCSPGSCLACRGSRAPGRVPRGLRSFPQPSGALSMERRPGPHWGRQGCRLGLRPGRAQKRRWRRQPSGWRRSSRRPRVQARSAYGASEALRRAAGRRWTLAAAHGRAPRKPAARAAWLACGASSGLRRRRGPRRPGCCGWCSAGAAAGAAETGSRRRAAAAPCVRVQGRAAGPPTRRASWR